MTVGHLAVPARSAPAVHTVTVRWLSPEFTQRWQLFAHDLERRRGLAVRVRVAAGAGLRTSPWVDLTAREARAARGRLVARHAELTELEALLVTVSSAQHGSREEQLAQRYLCRVATQRLAGLPLGGPVVQVQARLTQERSDPPPWQRPRPGARGARQVVLKTTAWLRVRPADRVVKGQRW
ncbi:DUF5819 family protein [Streptomyces roseifaciens]|uniref:DUF5819 family protein n=1 Tax=Streptomyces roseifaciens TaxID=1488406 RepID=UPI001FE1A51E|nr:DUF5819 family protein [Streptomyces roseifaciens]